MKGGPGFTVSTTHTHSNFLSRQRGRLNNIWHIRKGDLSRKGDRSDVHGKDDDGQPSLDEWYVVMVPRHQWFVSSCRAFSLPKMHATHNHDKNCKHKTKRWNANVKFLGLLQSFRIDPLGGAW